MKFVLRNSFAEVRRSQSRGWGWQLGRSVGPDEETSFSGLGTFGRKISEGWQLHNVCSYLRTPMWNRPLET